MGPGREETTNQGYDSKQSPSEGNWGLMWGALETAQVIPQRCPYQGVRDLKNLYTLSVPVHKLSPGTLTPRHFWVLVCKVQQAEAWPENRDTDAGCWEQKPREPFR